VATELVPSGPTGESAEVIVLFTRAELSSHLETLRGSGRSVGLVPTMGALHAGHLSLVAAAARECDVVALTIFVNPLQFGPGEDLGAYPRPIERDLRLAENGGVDVVFTPTTEEMYPESMATTVHVRGLTGSMEGASRPSHFDGVTTVVTKLFSLAGPCRAYFGEKDYQQLAVVTRLARDLDFPVTVVPCPIAREDDGLALSSRNVHLDAEQRAAAVVLYRALQTGAAMIAGGERDGATVAARMAGVVADAPTARLDYAEVVHTEMLEPVGVVHGGQPVRLLVAAAFGSTRLLDNIGVVAP